MTHVSDYDKRVVVDLFGDDSLGIVDRDKDLEMQVAYYDDVKRLLIRIEDKRIKNHNNGVGFLMDETKTRRLIEALEQALVKLGSK